MLNLLVSEPYPAHAKKEKEIKLLLEIHGNLALHARHKLQHISMCYSSSTHHSKKWHLTLTSSQSLLCHHVSVPGFLFKFQCTSICLFLFLLFCDHVFCSCVLKLYVQLRCWF